MSANRIARDAGVTWGTIAHQFGDADGVWAAVLAHVADDISKVPFSKTTGQRSLARQISLIIEWMEHALDSPSARAVQTIRSGLPSDRKGLISEFPKTASALDLVDAAWSRMVADSLDGLVASKVKLRRAGQLLPAAMHGIQAQAGKVPVTDPKDARRGLADALTAYLQG
jgi:AcrR family transcriptional regulator